MSEHRPHPAVLVVAICLAVSVAAAAAVFTAGSGTTFDATDGPAVTIQNDQRLDGGNPFPTTGSVKVGNTTFGGPGGSSLAVDDADAASPTLSNIDTNGGQVTADSNRIQKVGVNESITQLQYQDADLQRSSTEFSVAGSGYLFVYGFTPGETIRANFANDNDRLETADGNGVITVPVSSGADITLVEDGGGPTLSNAAPRDNTTVSESPVELQVDVSDPDFDTGNEEVELEWRADGEVDGTTTVTSNGTATFQPSDRTGGQHNWSVTATDVSGASDRAPDTGVYQYRLPSALKIFNESAPKDRITGGTEVRVRFFDINNNDIAVERSTTDGIVSLAGLPADQRFIVLVEADGFELRRVLIESLTEQQEVYLLPESTDSVNVRVSVEDRTGNFGKASFIQLERALNTTGTEPEAFEQRVVTGDVLGANAELETVLARGVRYRARLVSPDGRERQLGAFTIDQSRLITFQVSELQQGVENADASTFLINATSETEGSGGSKEKTVDVLFTDPANETNSLDLVVHESGDPANVFAETSASSSAVPLGQFRYQQTFRGEAANTSLVANVTLVRGGETIQRTVPLGVNEFPLGLPLGSGWSQIFGVGFLIIFGGIFSVKNARIGALILPGVGLVLYQTGILNGVLTVAGIGIAFGLAVGYNIVLTTGPDGLVAQ